MIHLKTPEQIEQMKAAGALSKAALRHVGAAIRPGISTLELDRIAEAYIRIHGGIPTFKGYGGFPGSACISVNEQIVHGIPSANTILKSGDIVTIDIGGTVGGWAGDNAWTFFVGEPSAEARELCEVTRDCMIEGIKEAVPGKHLGDIGAAVQELAERHGFGVIRDFVGHGLGHTMHEEPNVPNYGRRGRGVRLQPGMVICIEPMIARGDYATRILANGWTVVTRDGSLSAHYENTVAITEDGPVIVSEDDQGSVCPLEGGVL